MLKVGFVLAALISILPINALRVLNYRPLGYKISRHVSYGRFPWEVGMLKISYRFSAFEIAATIPITIRIMLAPANSHLTRVKTLETQASKLGVDG